MSERNHPDLRSNWGEQMHWDVGISGIMWAHSPHVSWDVMCKQLFECVTVMNSTFWEIPSWQPVELKQHLYGYLYLDRGSNPTWW